MSPMTRSLPVSNTASEPLSLLASSTMRRPLTASYTEPWESLKLPEMEKKV